MGGGGGQFADEDVGATALLRRRAGHWSKAGQSYPVGSERFGLRNVDRRIEVEEIARRAVRLVARLSAKPVRPCRPPLHERFQQQVCHGLTII